MPTVANGPNNIRIEQRYREHHPAHFHAVQGADELSIRIADLVVQAGQMNPMSKKIVLDWARDHQAELALNWVKAQAQMALDYIVWP